jgi:hypothetical protein
LVDILLVVVIDGFRLNLFGNLLIAWCEKSLLGFELVAEDDKALTCFDLSKLWVLSILDFLLELLFSGLLVIVLTTNTFLVGGHSLDPSNSIVLDFVFHLILEEFFTKLILGLVDL